jgi:hypothetical protein
MGGACADDQSRVYKVRDSAYSKYSSGVTDAECSP